MSTDPKNIRKTREVSQDVTGRRVAVIGAGAAGLSCAHHLKKRGVTVEVLERTERVGGAMRSSFHEDRYIIDAGPSYFHAGSSSITSIARELSIDKLMVGDPKQQIRPSVYADGELARLPSGGVSLLTGSKVPLQSSVKLMMGPKLTCDRSAGLTLSEFIRFRMGDEVFSSIVSPIAAWTTWSNPDELEAESVLPWIFEGWRLPRCLRCKSEGMDEGAIRPGIQSFKWGMGTLAARLEEVLRGSIHTQSECISIEPKDEDGFILSFRESRRLSETDAVVIATSAHHAAEILSGLDDAVGRHLDSIPYAPIVIASLAFDANDIEVGDECLIVMMPKGEGTRVIGAMITSRLFPNRCPAGQELITVLIGGTGNEDVVGLSDDDLIDIASEGLSDAMGITDKPRFTNVKRVNRAIPQYTMGHARRIAEIEECLAERPGVFLTGNYFSGVSVSDTIAHGRSAGDAVLDYLRSS